MRRPGVVGLPGWQTDDRPGRVRADLLAGLTVWAVLIPESLAYATIAGVSPVVGLYAAVPSLLIYALLGSSRHLVVAPLSATAALSATVAATYSSGGAADYLRVTITLTIVVGVLGVLAGLLRLGFVTTFISEPVLKGFIIGLAFTILLGQVPDLIGVEKAGGDVPAELVGLVRELPGLHVATAVIGVGALALLLGLRRLAPGVPGSLVVVVLGIVASALFDLAGRGVEVVGGIEAGLPSVGLPDSTPGQYAEILGPAAGVLLVGFAEGLAAAKAYAARDGYPLDVDRDLAAIGAANLGSGLCGGLAVSGSLSKTAVNGAAGARTQLSGVVVSALTVLTLLLLTPLFEGLPEAVLAAVVIGAVVDLLDLGALTRLYGLWTAPLGRIYRFAARADFIAATGALIGVLLFELLPGLAIGVGLSLVLLLYRTAHPYVARLVRAPGPAGDWVDAERHPGLEAPEHVVVLRVEGGLFFGNAEQVRQRLLGAAGEAPVVVLDAGSVPSIDVSAAEMLVRVVADLRGRHVELRLAQVHGQVRDLLAAVGPEAFDDEFFADVEQAVTGRGSGTTHDG